MNENSLLKSFINLGSCYILMQELNKRLEEKIIAFFGDSSNIPDELDQFLKSINSEFEKLEKEKIEFRKTTPEFSPFEIGLNKNKQKSLNEKKTTIKGSKSERGSVETEHLLYDVAIKNLLESEEKYRLLYENAVEGIFQSTANGNFITVNPSLARMLKYDSAKDLITSIGNIELLYSNPEQKGQVSRMLNELGSVRGFEVQMTCKDNEKIWVNQNIRRVNGKNGQFLYFEGCIIDITERKYIEEIVTDSENRLRSLIEYGSDIISLIEKDGRIRFESPSVLRQLGYESIGKNYLDIIHPDDHVKFKGFLDELLQKKASLISLELRFLIKDGSWRVYEVLGNNLIDDSYVEGIVLNSRDITERKKVEEELRKASIELEKRVEERTYELTRANESLMKEISERRKTELELISAKDEAENADKVKTEFLAQVSHEIRTPINVILNYGSLIRFELEQLSREDLTQLFNSVERASSRLMRTIDLIVNMAQIQSQSFKPNFKQVDILRLLTQLHTEYNKLANDIGLELYLKQETNDTYIMADEYTLLQVFQNLVDNAVKYTREGYIEIKIYSSKDDRLCIDVKDTGIGIAQEFIPKLFTPFVQEETGYTRRYEGNGLGLAIVKKYAELNNGKVSLQSEKGKGSVFTVSFQRG